MQNLVTLRLHGISHETNWNKLSIGAIQNQQTLHHYTVCHRNCIVHGVLSSDLFGAGGCLTFPPFAIFFIWNGSVFFLLPLLVFLLFNTLHIYTNTT